MLVPSPFGIEIDSLVERRRHPRRRGGDLKVRISDYKAEAQPVEGTILDRSAGGLCLAVPRFVAAGSVISVRPVNAPEMVPWVHVEVMYTNTRADHWVIGCQFTHLVPWSVRVLFG